jgi:outer membrane protein insertion porin family
LLRRLAGKGFLDATVASEAIEESPNAGVIGVRVRHHVTPGAMVRVGEVIIQGNYFTRDSVLRDTLPFATGDVLDPEQLASAQTDVYRLGIFRSVSVQPESTTGESRDVAVRVAERPAGELQYGVGYDTRAGVHNFLQIGHRNIAGSGDQLTLRGDLNLSPNDLIPDEYIASLEGKQPHFLGSRYDLKGNVARQQSERSIDEFSIRETSMSGGFEREFVRGLRGSLVLEFQDSDIFDVQPDAVLTGKDVGKLRTVSLNPILIYDGRDDPFAPTRGVFDSLRLRYASPRLGSDVNFFKIVAQHSQYVPLTKTITGIYGARIGWAKVLGDSEVIPIRDRFFLGGRTSVRGYDENEIGPRGANGNPIGGDFLVNVLTEIRFPLFYGAGGAIFADGGGLYLQDRGISMGDFRGSVGPGLRYQTPVGSISLDYGFKIRRRSDESIGEIHFTIGNIF